MIKRILSTFKKKKVFIPLIVFFVLSGAGYIYYDITNPAIIWDEVISEKVIVRKNKEFTIIDKELYKEDKGNKHIELTRIICTPNECVKKKYNLKTKEWEFVSKFKIIPSYKENI